METIALIGAAEIAFEPDLLAAVYKRTHRLARAFGREYLRDATSPALALVYRLWPSVGEEIRICPFRAAVLLTNLLALEGEGPGVVVEYGVSRGGALALMALASQEHRLDLSFIGLDTFSGLPTPDRRFDAAYREGQFASSRSEVEELLGGIGADMGRITLIEGDIREAGLPPDCGNVRLVHLDLDLFEPTLIALQQVRAIGSDPVLVLDDVFDGSGGVRRAAHLERLALSAGPTGQAVVSSSVRGSYGELWHRYAAFLKDCRTAVKATERPILALALEKLEGLGLRTFE